MLSNLLTCEIPEVISFKKPGGTTVIETKVSLAKVGPRRGTMKRGRPRGVKRTPKKPRTRLASAMAKGKAKARMRAKARAEAKRGFEFNNIELDLEPNIFDETDSEAEAVSEITEYHEYNFDDWQATWFVDMKGCTHITDDGSSALYNAIIAANFHDL
jgi:hypothetical protein